MSLRFAYNTNGCANHLLDDALLLIAESGYQGVALTLDHHHLDPFAADWSAQAQRLAKRLRELGLGCVVETGARFLLDPRAKHEPTLVSPNADGRARRIEFLERSIDIAAILQAEAVSFWSGVPLPSVERHDAHSWLIDGLLKVVSYAQRHDVTAAFEPEPGMLIETAAEWEALAVSDLALALDTGHCLVTEDTDPAVAVRRYADRLGTVALEDMKRGIHLHLPFGEGDMNVPSVLEALQDIGFAKLVCVELSRESPRAHQAIPEAIAWLKAHGG